MGTYKLDPGEAVIMQAQRASIGTFSNVSLILTNKNLIQVNRGLLGGDKSSEKYPLEQLKVYNGKANVIVGKDRTGNKQLEVYFEGYEKFYRIEGLFAESKWAAAITKAHKQVLDELAKSKKSESNGGLLRSISSTIDSAKEKVSSKKQPGNKSIKCPKCGAELVGAKGTLVTCEYCNSKVVIK